MHSSCWKCWCRCWLFVDSTAVRTFFYGTETKQWLLNYVKNKETWPSSAASNRNESRTRPSSTSCNKSTQEDICRPEKKHQWHKTRTRSSSTSSNESRTRSRSLSSLIHWKKERRLAFLWRKRCRKVTHKTGTKRTYKNICRHKKNQQSCRTRTRSSSVLYLCGKAGCS